MGVDVFGRRLVEEVHRGPPGIGFALTASGDFDIENKLKNIQDTIAGANAVLKDEIINSLKEKIKTDLRGELKPNTSSTEHIECMLVNKSENCV